MLIFFCVLFFCLLGHIAFHIFAFVLYLLSGLLYLLWQILHAAEMEVRMRKKNVRVSSGQKKCQQHKGDKKQQEAAAKKFLEISHCCLKNEIHVHHVAFIHCLELDLHII